MARIFGVSEDVTNTRRAVGTYSYIAPEYAMEGLFSEKSNVFSFGVILLEIVSGRKNTSFYHDEQQSLSLIGFTWKLWKEDNFISLIDKEMHDPEFGRGILRCLHIGLLRVQELARERPTMATVVSMLNSEIINLPSPTQPAFILRQNVLAAASSQSSDKFCSFNNVSITNIQGR